MAADEDGTEDVETTEQLAAVATSVETEETEETLALSITKPTIRNVAAHTRSCLPGPLSPVSPVSPSLIGQWSLLLSYSDPHTIRLNRVLSPPPGPVFPQQYYWPRKKEKQHFFNHSTKPTLYIIDEALYKPRLKTPLKL